MAVIKDTFALLAQKPGGDKVCEGVIQNKALVNLVYSFARGTGQVELDKNHKKTIQGKEKIAYAIHDFWWKNPNSTAGEALECAYSAYTNS